MKPVGITMGCPVGIGPEITLKYFESLQKKNQAVNCVVLGDIEVLRSQARYFSINIDCIPWQPGLPLPQNGVPVYEISHLNPEDLHWGQPTLATGRAMATAIKEGVRLFQNDCICALTTCPISKKNLQEAGYNFPGHTEMLADLCGEKRFTMMLAGTRLRVTLVTIHCGFKDIIASLSSQNILERIHLTHESLCCDFALANPKIAVASLNPHAGENGVIGSEESDILLPAIRAAQAQDINVKGPFPPDTIFYQASRGLYDAVVCMYHDQGLIPFKLLHFDDGVNVTIGLSLIRTSVDHGTAYDIAGKGIATFSSLSAAVTMAQEIAFHRKTFSSSRQQ